MVDLRQFVVLSLQCEFVHRLPAMYYTSWSKSATCVEVLRTMIFWVWASYAVRKQRPECFCIAFMLRPLVVEWVLLHFVRR